MTRTRIRAAAARSSPGTAPPRTPARIIGAATETGFCPQDEDITVRLRGGDLRVRYTDEGGITVTIPNNAVPTIGNVWVIWQEPGNLGTFSTGASDNCPSTVASLGLSPAPRCVYTPFRL